jgi:hypothetical protein
LGSLGLLGRQSVEVGLCRLLLGLHARQRGALLAQLVVEAARRGGQVLTGGAVAVDRLHVAERHVLHHCSGSGDGVDVLLEQQRD